MTLLSTRKCLPYIIGLIIAYMAMISIAFAQPGRGKGPRKAHVYVETVLEVEFANVVEALGTLEPKEQVRLSVNAADRVTAVYFDDGERVTAGKTLLILAQAEQAALLEAAEATENEAYRQLQRVTRLAKQKAVSQSELDQARRDYNSAKAQKAAVQSRLQDHILVAPFDGVLGFREVSVGTFLTPGDMVSTLIDDSEMRLEFPVPSIFLRALTVGTEINAVTTDLPDMTFAGRVTSIDNAIDPVTRSIRVRATLPNDELLLRSGMFMTVKVQSNPRTALSIPEGSIEPRGPLNFVYVADQNAEGNPVARRQEIKIGLRLNGQVEVLEGLKAGEKVITDGLISVRDGSPLNIQDNPNDQPDTPSSNGSSTGQSSAASAGN